jgi:hypothetical protein
MAKKRKTREQKILAETRHNFSHAFTGQVPFTAKIQTQINSSILTQTAPKTTVLNAYPYLIKDLTKTALLTLGIFIFQIILFTLLRNHVIFIPGISY